MMAIISPSIKGRKGGKKPPCYVRSEGINKAGRFATAGLFSKINS